MSFKQKVIFAVSIVSTLFIGVIGTIVVYDKFIAKKDVVEKTVSEVNITMDNTLKPAIEKVYDAVYVVETYKSNKTISSGTGFVYKTDDKYGYIITNNHVIESGDKIIVINNKGEEIEAKLLGSDLYADLAVLSIEKEHVTTIASIGKSAELNLGDKLFTVGAPVGSEYSGTITDGIVSGIDRLVSVNLSGSTGNSDWQMNVIQTNAAINPGNSGGPLCNINGEVVGVTSLKLVDSQIEGMGFAIPIDFVMTYVDKLEKGEEIQRPLLGVSLLDIDETYSLYRNGIILDDDVDSGVVVAGVNKDSPADKAGLKKGDVILDIDGQKVNDKATLRYTLYSHNIGDKITINYYRDGKIAKTEVTLNQAYES